ncbi:MAG TPA: sporulation integral membrane protein YlbJ [Clostridia bacterium]|nr:sporulation integral membrane protein YlbJ [Clostridia bacterium]
MHLLPKQGWTSLLRLTLLLCLAAIMMLHPQQIFPAAKRGIDTWWQVVFPGLFPFFVISELMIQLGVVHFLSIFLEPVMRPLFNVPGAGALVVAAGYTSGAPIGGILTSQLHRQNLIDREEAARLVAFTNNASPLFMLSSVAVGFLHLPQVGWLLALSHYSANIITGVFLKYLSPPKTAPAAGYPLRTLFRLAVSHMEKARQANHKPFGHLLGDATKKAMQNILVVGGFIIVFSVLIEILTLLGFVKIAGAAIGYFLIPLGFAPDLLVPLASGLLEMTIGIKMVSESNAPFLQQLVCTSLLLGWAGVAVHAQVAAFTSEAGIPFGPYFLARGLQACLSGIITFIAGLSVLPFLSLEVIQVRPPSAWTLVLQSVKTMAAILGLLSCMSLMAVLRRSIRT